MANTGGLTITDTLAHQKRQYRRVEISRIIRLHTMRGAGNRHTLRIRHRAFQRIQNAPELRLGLITPPPAACAS